MQANLASNIWKFAILLIANKRLVVAIFGVYYLTIPGVTPLGVGLIIMAGSIAGFLFEIPSGYLSDKFGHKQALVLSRIFLVCSTLFYLFAGNIGGLIIGSVLLSLGIVFLSGTGSAFMHETLRGLNRENDYTRVMGKVSAVGFAVPIALMVIVPFFVEYSFKIPFLIMLAIDLIGLAAALSLVVPKVTQEQIDEIAVTNFRKVMKEGYVLGFFRYALFGAIIGGVLHGAAVFRPLYQELLNVPVIYFGVLFGIGRVLASLLLTYSGAIKDRFSVLSFFKLELITNVSLFLILGLIADPVVVVVVFILINGLQWGFSKVNEGYLLDIIRDSKFKATLISAKSQMKEFIAAASGFLVGYSIEKVSYQDTFLYVGVFLGIILTVLYVYISRKHKS